MRVLHCVTTLDPTLGGSVEAGRLLAAGMLKQGIQVEVASLDPPGDQWQSNWPCTVHRLGPARGSYQYSPRLIPWLVAHESSYDSIVVHNMYRYIGYAVWRAGRKTGVPYYLFTHGMLDPWFKRPSLKALKKYLFWQAAGYRMLRDAAAVLYTAEDEKTLAGIGDLFIAGREHVVGLGIEDPCGQRRMADGELRQALGLPSNPAYLLFLGRITEKKRVDLLIRGFAAAFRDDDTRLVIAGPDENGLRRRFSQLPEAVVLGERLVWTGHLDGPRKWAAIAGADAMALISHTENFGISLAESLAMGVPVLTTNKVNIWREIVSGGAGFAEDDDLQGALRLLNRWRVTPRPDKSAMRDRARAVFQSSFAIDSVVSRLLPVMQAGNRARHA